LLPVRKAPVQIIPNRATKGQKSNTFSFAKIIGLYCKNNNLYNGSIIS